MNKVDKKRAWRVWLSWGTTAVLGLAMGCGEIGGAGQCNGVDVIGACVTVDSVVPTDPVGFGADTQDVDAFQTPACSSGTPEPFGEHAAKVMISASLMKGVTSPPAPAFITFTSYTIAYIPSSTNLTTAPALTTQSFGPMTLKINTDGTAVTNTLEFVNVPTKQEYVKRGGSTTPTSYSAQYTFQGTSQFNQDVVLIGSATFNIGDYQNCK